jgi:YhcH/YjgK/YiaL family protein
MIMILDQIKNWRDYPYGDSWKQAFNFLENLQPDSEDKKYIISGDDIFAIVTSYKTRSYKDAIFEAHRKYIDIQAVISGHEKLEWSTKEGQQLDVPYDESKDVEFYKHTLPRAGKIDLYPGIFIMLLPQDVHMPSLIFMDKTDVVKKVVIKLKIDLLK